MPTPSLPEPDVALRLEGHAVDPLDALVAIHERHDQAYGKTLPIGQGLAVQVRRQQHFGAPRLFERERVRIDATDRPERDEACAAAWPSLFQQWRKLHPLPVDVAH